jgi:hypothetical protein
VHPAARMPVRGGAPQRSLLFVAVRAARHTAIPLCRLCTRAAGDTRCTTRRSMRVESRGGLLASLQCLVLLATTTCGTSGGRARSLSHGDPLSFSQSQSLSHCLTVSLSLAVSQALASHVVPSLELGQWDRATPHLLSRYAAKSAWAWRHCPAHRVPTRASAPAARWARVPRGCGRTTAFHAARDAAGAVTSAGLILPPAMQTSRGAGECGRLIATFLALLFVSHA